MTAEPVLALVAALLKKHRLEVVLIGNAAAALQGSPVTTLDIDFMFRSTPGNLKKLKAIARDLGAAVLRPYYPVSQLFRVARDADGLQIDFMARIDGIRSFQGLSARAVLMTVAGHDIRVADLADIIKSKAAAGRPQDLAVLPVLRMTLREKTKSG